MLKRFIKVVCGWRSTKQQVWKHTYKYRIPFLKLTLNILHVLLNTFRFTFLFSISVSIIRLVIETLFLFNITWFCSSVNLKYTKIGSPEFMALSWIRYIKIWMLHNIVKRYWNMNRLIITKKCMIQIEGFKKEIHARI